MHPICNKFKRCTCERCTVLDRYKNLEDGCAVCELDNTIHPTCKIANEFVRKGILKEMTRHG